MQINNIPLKFLTKQLKTFINKMKTTFEPTLTQKISKLYTVLKESTN